MKWEKTAISDDYISNHFQDTTLLCSLIFQKQESRNMSHTNLTGLKYIKVHTATRCTIRHSLILLWFADLMNVTEAVTIHRPNVSTLLSSAFIRGGLNAPTKGAFI